MNVPLSAVLAPLSDSWRRRYEQLGSNAIGDTRHVVDRYPFVQSNVSNGNQKDGSIGDHVSEYYPWNKNVSGEKNMGSIQKPSETDTSKEANKKDDTDSHMLIWRQLLQCGQNLLRKM